MKSNDVNRQTAINNSIHEILNATINHAPIMQAITFNRAFDISALPKHPGENCIVIGSGASLDGKIEMLKDWKGGIICTPSQASTLVYFGVTPSHVFMLDPFHSRDDLAGIDWGETETILITTPTVTPEILSNWPNKIGLYRQNDGNSASFFNTTLAMMYSTRTLQQNARHPRECDFSSIIKTSIPVFASSPPLQMFSASILGYQNVFLMGVDFCCMDGKERFTSFKKHGQWWDCQVFDLKEDVGQFELSDNGYPCEPIQKYYKRNLFSAIRLFPNPVFVVGHGAIFEIPVVSVSHMIETQGNIQPWPFEQYLKAVDDYLTSHGVYPVESPNGVIFVESDNPAVEVVNYMTVMNRIYGCKCGGRFESDEDATGHYCPTCAVGKLFKVHGYDIQANLDRLGITRSDTVA